MFAIASKITYQDGQLIFKEGNPAESLYIVLSGSVEISKMVKGKKNIVELLPEGEVFGELPFLGEVNHEATARTIGETTLGLLDQDVLNQELDNLSSDFRAVLAALAKRMKMMMLSVSGHSPWVQLRIPKALAVTFKNEQTIVKAYASDISEGGLFIGMEKPFKKGEQFYIELHIPGLSEPMEIKCEVAWSREKAESKVHAPAGMGVKFLERSKEQNEILKPYVRTIAKIGLKTFDMSERDNQILKQYLHSVAKMDR